MRQAKAGDSILIRPAVKNMQILEKELVTKKKYSFVPI
jgi:hypothetical protein